MLNSFKDLLWGTESSKWTGTGSELEVGLRGELLLDVDLLPGVQLLKIRDAVRDPVERLLIYELNSQSNRTPPFRALEPTCWLDGMITSTTAHTLERQLEDRN